MILRRSPGLLPILMFFALAVLFIETKLTDIPVFLVSSQKDTVPILMYHKVSPYPQHGGPGLRVTPAMFEKQMKYLSERGFHTISPDDLVSYWDKKKPLPSRPILLTFDDGYEDNYRFAFPILKKFGYTATIFLVYNDIGKYNVWDDNHNVARQIKLMNWPQIRIMQKYGISMQSHTLTHPNLTSLNIQDAQKEISLSKQKLEKALSVPVDFIAYPYGRRNPVIDRIARQAGYKAGFSTILGRSTQGKDRFRLRRLRINGDVDINEFAHMVERQWWKV